MLLENVLDVHPEYIRDVCDGVDDPRLRICLDVGHANVYSQAPAEQWIEMLGSRIVHVHMHNNDGFRDLHAQLDEGSLDVERVLRHLDAYAPAADICIESVDALSCIRTLEKRGVITDEKSL
ncbi:MAG: TIM barrel protein [Eubacteriales bacterium]|nr:TIM barrel protein [Eubacteriales bacterium]